MIKSLKVSLVSAAIVFSSGCSYIGTAYGISADNVQAMKQIGSVQVSITDFTAGNPGENSIGCRAAGPIEAPNKTSFEKYIQDAFKSELSLAGLYNEKADIKLTGYLEKVDFSSNIGLGNWVFVLQAISSNSKKITVNSNYEFSTNFAADKACQQVAQALSPAVQKLIHDIITHPEFNSLLVPANKI